MEILVHIFNFLSPGYMLVNCAKTCLRWKEIIAHLYMKPNLPMFAKLDDDIQKILKEEGWSEQCTNIYTIVSAYEKATSYKARVLVTTGVTFRKSSFDNR